MNRIIYSCFLFISIFLSGTVFAQLTFTTPLIACSGQTTNAIITSTPATATSYTLNVNISEYRNPSIN